MVKHGYRACARVVAYIEVVFNTSMFLLVICAVLYLMARASGFKQGYVSILERQENRILTVSVIALCVPLGVLKLWTVALLMKATSLGRDPAKAISQIGNWRIVLIVLLVLEVILGSVQRFISSLLIAVSLRALFLFVVTIYLRGLQSSPYLAENAHTSKEEVVGRQIESPGNQFVIPEDGDPGSRPEVENDIPAGTVSGWRDDGFPYMWRFWARVVGYFDMVLIVLSFVGMLPMFMTNIFMNNFARPALSEDKQVQANLLLFGIFLVVFSCVLLKLWAASRLHKATEKSVGPAKALRYIRKWQAVVIVLAIFQLPFATIETYVLVELATRVFFLLIVECYTEELYNMVIISHQPPQYTRHWKRQC